MVVIISYTLCGMVDKEEELEFMKKLEKIQRKKFRKENEDLMDELLPKATGRERLLEKKAIRREDARNREDSPEIFKERDIMGGGDDFKQRFVAWILFKCSVTLFLSIVFKRGKLGSFYCVSGGSTFVDRNFLSLF